MVLIHNGARPWHKWEPILSDLTQRYDVLVPTIPGFAGGPPLTHAATIGALADGVEAAMDSVGFKTAHCVGNSIGGWIAMELARRGRARSVVAFSPAGGWDSRWARLRIKTLFVGNYTMAKLARRLTPVAMRIRPVRSLLLRMVVAHPGRLTSIDAIRQAEDLMDGDLPRVLGVIDSPLEAYPDLGIPTMVAWSERDRLTPLKRDGDVWRRCAPHAEWRVLPGLGHLPMFDDPQLTLATILSCTAQVR